MRAVVLVGGFGTRLRPLTLDTPKQMLPILGVPMIERVLTRLAADGVTDAVLSLGFRPDAFQHAYPDDTCAGVRLGFATEPEPLDTAGAIRFAAEAAGLDETFLVVNGDILCDLDSAALVAFHHERGGEATIHLYPVDDPSRFGVVPTDAEGRVERFVEKPPPGQAPTNLINAGTYVMEPSVLDRIADGRPVSVEREVFPALAGDGVLFGMAAGSRWRDVGTPQSYLDAQLAMLDDGLEGIDPRATVDPDAAVRRSVVGREAVVEAEATVYDSVLLAGAVVRSGAVVEDSIVGRDVEVPSEASVLNGSVLGAGAEIAPGEALDAARRPG